MFQNFNKVKAETTLIVGLMILSGFAHSFNMFNYPYYENDEGTYMSQAWAVSEKGALAPYTYWYDHAPAGWIFIAAWAKLTGGYFTFGDAVVSGRIFMLVLHLCTTGLLYYIARKISGSILAATVAVLFFALSPLGIYFQRRILLDNIMLFWSMFSIALLLVDKIKMRHILLSGLTFGIAMLTKENAIFFIPALLYGISLHSHSSHKRIAIVQWLAVSISVGSLYLLYALLKGELMPVESNEERVSLIDTLTFQGARGSGLPFWNPESDFLTTFMTWVGKDPYILFFGIISVIILGIFAIQNKKLRMPTLLSVFFWAFLMRGGLIIDFYIVPLIPLFALATGVVVQKISSKFPMKYNIPVSIALMLIVIMPSVLHSQKHYVNNETESQLQSIEWIRSNVPADNNVVIENSIYLDLRNPEKGPVFNNADYYWKAELDPEIRTTKYNDTWKNVDYIMVSHETLKNIRNGEGNFIATILDNSELVGDWGPSSQDTYVNVEQNESTNGDWAQVYKVRDPDEVYLTDSWNAYKGYQIISYGQVIDTFNSDRTTSEGQSYAMLRSVWMNDKETFDGVWSWTKDHMQFRENDALLSWLWEKKSNEYVQSDFEAATDADEDIALALLFAYKKFGDPKYLEEAKEIIGDIWNYEVVSINGGNYLVANTRAQRANSYFVNPSYFSPAAYRIFAEVDPTHDWMSVVDSSYDILEALSIRSDELSLPSDWILLDATTGAISSATEYFGPTANTYGYDAFRVMWRIALDSVWHNEPRARIYLQKYQNFFNTEWKEGRLASVYTTEGMPVTETSNISTDIGVLSIFTVTDRKAAEEFYQERIAGSYKEGGFWEEQDNYYAQNWAWFGTALHKGKLNNYWE